MSERMYFPSRDVAWHFANLISEARGYVILDYGYDMKGYFIEFTKEA